MADPELHLRLPMVAFEDVLPPCALDELQAQCEVLFDFSNWQLAYSHDSGSKQSQSSTFWLGVGEEPRCGLEQAVRAFERRTFPQGCSAYGIGGGEFWVQVRKSDGAMDWHFDKDEAEAESEGTLSYPSLSTVFYFGYHAAPT